MAGLRVRETARQAWKKEVIKTPERLVFHGSFGLRRAISPASTS